MRHQGKITNWKDDKGFGFIVPNGGGEPVFVHIKAFSNRQRRPFGDEIVSYRLVSDGKGRTRAEDIEFIDDNSRIVASSQSGMGFLAVPLLFLTFVAGSVLVGKLPFAVLAIYLVASAASFPVYAHDKAAARKNQWRTAESTLHLLSLIGGWPGAFIAQNLLRHKSKKQPFQIVFLTTVVLNCLGLGWLFSPSGSDAFRSLLGASELMGR